MDRRKDTKEKTTLIEHSAFDSGLNVLFLAGFPLVLWLFQGSAVLIVTAVVEMILFSMALRLISTGQKLHRAYDAAEIAHHPRVPRKLIGSALIGLVVFVLAGHHFSSIWPTLVAGLAAAGLSVAAFGPDPLKSKGLDDPEILERQQCQAMIEEIEDSLHGLGNSVALLGDSDLSLRTNAASDMVLRLTRTMGTDATALRKMRKPVGKFIQILGAEVDRLGQDWDSDNFLFARRRYVAKLEVMAESFEKHARKGGAKSGRDAFDVEADLLLDRIPQESAA